MRQFIGQNINVDLSSIDYYNKCIRKR